MFIVFMNKKSKYEYIYSCMYIYIYTLELYIHIYIYRTYTPKAVLGYIRSSSGTGSSG